MPFTLKIARGEGAGQQLAFDQPCVTLGRSSRCDVRLLQDRISRQHARIVSRSGAYYLEDLSANGTRVNGRRVEKVQLDAGDLISLGQFVLHFSVAPPAVSETQPAVDPGTRILSRDTRPQGRVPKSLPNLWKRRAILLIGWIAAAALISLKALCRHSEPPLMEPGTLSRIPIGGSFGLGEGVTFVHRTAKEFDFEFQAPGRAVVLLRYQSRDISAGEVKITANGAHVGSVPPDGQDPGQVWHEVILGPELLKHSERNQIVFENTRNPPLWDTWRIWNIWVDVNMLPEMAPELLRGEASASFRRAQENLERRDVGAANRYLAWRDYRNAWLTLEAHPVPRPELYLLARERLEEAHRELDHVCSKLLLETQRAYQLRDRAGARASLDQVKAYFPGNEHPCPMNAEQKRTELGL